MLIIWKFPKSIAGRTKGPRGPRVWDPCSKCCKNFEDFTNPASAPRTKLHKTHHGFTVFFQLWR